MVETTREMSANVIRNRQFVNDMMLMQKVG